MVWPLKNDISLESFVGGNEANFEMFLHLTRLLMGDPPFPGSIVVGSERYIECVKSFLGGYAKERKSRRKGPAISFASPRFPMGEFWGSKTRRYSLKTPIFGRLIPNNQGHIVARPQ